MHLAMQKVEEIRVMYGKQIGTDTFEDWQSTLQKKYGTLVWLKNVMRIPPMVFQEAMAQVGLFTNKGM